MTFYAEHHDGFALFDMAQNISARNSVVYGPKKDLLKELFDAAKTYQPQLRRGNDTRSFRALVLDRHEPH